MLAGGPEMIAGLTGAAVGASASAVDVSCRHGNSKGGKYGEGGGVIGHGVIQTSRKTE